ncbi:MAG TPA: flagellar motor protein MotB [Candidatus Acidoferrales bacterium]|nr:flagellar motor protein MotB [Candidatus Acidoferrales bacterium]
MKKKAEGVHDNLERWLLTYADLITLLLGLFVILYASSRVDIAKYKEVMSAFVNLFGGGPAATGNLMGEKGVMNNLSPVSHEKESVQLEKKVEAAVGEALKGGGAIITHDERGVTVHFLEKFMFEVGKSEIHRNAYPVLDTLGFLLQSIPNRIYIEGHTDNTPIHTPQFPSNWHLSVARSLNVGYYLLQNYQIRPEKVSIMGYGEFHPLVPNDTPLHKAENRRVDIVILNSTAKD